MQKIFNKDGFNWWIGVVEDRDDPERIGRCRVRIYGLNTDSKELLPTKDLPWAIPIQPITSAATSGLGTSPLGPVTGTWVIGFFLDGEDMQQPAMFGTISTKGAGKGYIESAIKDILENKNDGVKKDKEGNLITDSEGNPVRAGVPEVAGWELGQSSEKFESGGRGPGTINDYQGGAKGDYGGASYGTYQFASFLPAVNEATGKARPSAKNTPLLAYIKASKFRDKLLGIEPATPAFDAIWKELASTNTAAFNKDQHDFIKAKYYDVMIANLQRSGYDMTKFGPGVQDLVWSTSVQYGPASVSVFTKPLKDKSQLADIDIISMVSDYKINTVNEYFGKNSQSIREGVEKRLTAEKSGLLNLVRA